MSTNLSEIVNKTVSVSEYLKNIREPFAEKFKERKKSYTLKREVIDELKKFARDHLLVVFSAEWCKDCAANIPVLALISEKTGLEVRVFGGLMKDPLSYERKWRIPPSPPEVETFNVDKIPLIIVFDKEGKEIGRIVENPREPTLEEDLLKIILKKHERMS